MPRLCAISFALALASTAAAFGLTFGAVGAEFQVNSTTAGYQTAPAVSLDPSGRSVAAWVSSASGGQRVVVALYRADGSVALPETAVSAGTACQGAPAVASAADGSFVVVWQEMGTDGDGWGVFAQRFTAGGALAGPEIQVNVGTAGDQDAPAVVYDPAGNFTVAWESAGPGTTGYDVLARRFDPSGNPLTGEVVLNATTAGDQRRPALAFQQGGNVAAAWESPDGDGTGVVLRTYSSNLAPLAAETAVNTTTAGFQTHPALACDGSGNCWVTWESSGQGGSGSGIYVRRFDRSVAPLTAELTANATTAGPQSAPRAAGAGSGDLLVVWESALGDAGSPGVFARRFDFREEPQGGELQVNSFSPGAQRRPAVAASPAGGFVAAWESEGQDGDGTGVYAQRYALSGLDFYTVAPCRVFDTRTTSRLASGLTRTFAVAGACGIPASARAIAANLTMVNPTGGANVQVFPGDAAPPGTSTINASAGQTRANNAIVTLARSGAGTIAVRPVVVGPGQVDLILDVDGYFQ